MHSFYLGVIDAANRANVSIYTMDAAGLRVNSDQARVRDAVNGAALGIATGYSVDGVSDSYLGRLEANSASLRSDPRYSLGVLADATGGLFFNNTNNLRPAFDRIRSDLRNYYLLGYTPSNGNYDGAFRKVEVRFKRPGVTIASRRGYFAVRDPGGAPINDWESGALGALEQQPVGNAFPVRAGAMHFPEPGRPGLVPVVVRVQTAPLSFVPAADGTSYTSNFTILVRFVDQADPQPRVVRRLSQHYEIRGPLAEMERARNGDVIFYRDSELPPGLYAMETVVFDAPTGKSSVRFSTIEVPRRAESTLVPVPSCSFAVARRPHRRTGIPEIRSWSTSCFSRLISASPSGKAKRNSVSTLRSIPPPAVRRRNPPSSSTRTACALHGCLCRSRRLTPTAASSSWDGCPSPTSRPAPTNCTPLSARRRADRHARVSST